MEQGADFRAWAGELNWAELPPGTLVVYSGGLLRAHGVYRIHDLSEGGYVLTTDELPYLRLNANRADIKPVEAKS